MSTYERPRSWHGDRVTALSFGEEAERYDRARPGYPGALAEFLLAEGADRVLDVGCGTGIATRLFAATGAQVLGLEPDRRMAEVARASGLCVEVERFEEWEAAGRTFDLLVCAQAWHWVDPVAGPVKAASLLEPGGHVACVWNVARGDAPVHELLAAILDRFAPDFAERAVLLGGAGAARAASCAAAFGAAASFEEAQLTTWQHLVTYDAPRLFDFLESHVPFRRLPSTQREAVQRALDDELAPLGGSVELAYEVLCVRCRRRR